MAKLFSFALLATSLQGALSIPLDRFDTGVKREGTVVYSRDTSLDATSIIDVDDPVDGALHATAWSLIYTNPIASYFTLTNGLLQATAVNELFHQRTFPEPGASGIVSPNLDTQYSFGPMDLSQKDLILTVPEIEENRFWSYTVFDLFGNAIAEISVVNGNTPGKYRIRRVNDSPNPVGFQPSDGYSSEQGTINVSTVYGTIAIRIGVLSTTPEDQTTINAYQDASTISLAALSASSTAAPALTAALPNTTISTPEQQLHVAARIAAYNPGQVVSDRARVASILALAGLANGTYSPVPDVDLGAGAAIAAASVPADLDDAAHWNALNNGWRLRIPAYQGTYATHYCPQSAFALAAYQTQAHALYADQPRWAHDGDLLGPLGASRSIVVTFSGKPPMGGRAGFWTLSVYNGEMDLIANDLDRYGLGSNSEGLVYADGSGERVYGEGADEGRDGVFKILVQQKDVAPPEEWMGNWLPVDGEFSLAFRFYWPGEALRDGSYVWPTFEEVDVITG